MNRKDKYTCLCVIINMTKLILDFIIRITQYSVWNQCSYFMITISQLLLQKARLSSRLLRGYRLILLKRLHRYLLEKNHLSALDAGKIKKEYCPFISDYKFKKFEKKVKLRTFLFEFFINEKVLEKCMKIIFCLIVMFPLSKVFLIKDF